MGLHRHQIKPKDGSIIFARTLEFAMDIQSNIIVVPRGKEYVGTAPGDKPGLRWNTKYGIVGANAFDMPVIVDGLNEKGLQVGLFYFPGFAKYQEIKAEDVGKTLAPWELGVFLLGTCADVKEASPPPRMCGLAKSSRRTWASCRACITSERCQRQ